MHIFSYAKKRHVSNFRFLFLFYFHRPFVFTFIKVQTFYEYNNKCIQQHFKPFHVVVSCQNLPQFLQICYSFMKYQYISDTIYRVTNSVWYYYQGLSFYMVSSIILQILLNAFVATSCVFVHKISKRKLGTPNVTLNHIKCKSSLYHMFDVHHKQLQFSISSSGEIEDKYFHWYFNFLIIHLGMQYLSKYFKAKYCISIVQ